MSMNYYIWITTIYPYFARAYTHSLPICFSPFFGTRHCAIGWAFNYTICLTWTTTTTKKINWKLLHRISILSKLRYNNNNKNDSRAIFTAWIVIVTTAIPVAIVHGVVNFPYNGRNYTACLFLVENGYNLVLFQVNKSLCFAKWICYNFSFL